MLKSVPYHVSFSVTQKQGHEILAQFSLVSVAICASSWEVRVAVVVDLSYGLALGIYGWP